MNQNVYDVAVIGLGAMGSAALYQLSRSTARVVGFDQYDPPHNSGSSHGSSRVTREAIGEGQQFCALAIRSHQIWREIEKQINQELLNTCGMLVYRSASENGAVHGASDFLQVTTDAASAFDIEHQLLDASELQKRFPQFYWRGDELGYYEPGAGFVRPEACITAQLRLAEIQGATVRRNSPVLSLSPMNGYIQIKTEEGTVEAEQLIISAGAWLHPFLPGEFQKSFKTYRQVLYWFEQQGPISNWEVGRMPVYLRLGGTEADFIYGFPAIDGEGGGVKVATEQFNESCDVRTMKREPDESEIDAMYQRVSRHVRIDSKLIHARACIYTVTPDFGFVIDRLPDQPNIILASPCSGHGFKHSAAIGEVLAQMALGQAPPVDLKPFCLSRFSQ